MLQKHYERVIFLNSFDLMMERYKRELVDANRRSIEQELLSQSERSEPESDVFVPESEEEHEAERALQKAEEKIENEEYLQKMEAVTVNAEPEMEIESDSDMPEEAEPEMTRIEEEPMKTGTKTEEPDDEADSFGTLKVQVFAAQQVYPISSARVIVRRNGEDKILFEGYTDSSGIVDNIRLPTPGK